MSPLSPSPLTIEHALLGLLRQTPMHGYEIHQQLADPAGLGLVWHVKQSRIYAMLIRLEERGYLQTELELQDSRPARKVFHLTPKGQAAYLHWIAVPVEHGRNFRVEFLAKLFCAQQEGETHAHHLLKVQRDACYDWLEKHQHEAENLPQNAAYDWLVIQFRLGQIEAMLAWLTVCEERLLQTKA